MRVATGGACRACTLAVIRRVSFHDADSADLASAPPLVLRNQFRRSTRDGTAPTFGGAATIGTPVHTPVRWRILDERTSAQHCRGSRIGIEQSLRVLEE